MALLTLSTLQRDVAVRISVRSAPLSAQIARESDTGRAVVAFATASTWDGMRAASAATRDFRFKDRSHIEALIRFVAFNAVHVARQEALAAANSKSRHMFARDSEANVPFTEPTRQLLSEIRSPSADASAIYRHACAIAASHSVPTEALHDSIPHLESMWRAETVPHLRAALGLALNEARERCYQDAL